MPTSFPTLPIIQQLVKDRGWKIYKEDHDSICMLFGPDLSTMEENYLVLFHTRDEEADLRVSVRGCVQIPEERRDKVAEYFGRANFGLTHGCFKLDESDGEIKFHTSADTENCNKNDILLLLEFYYNVATLTWIKYLPGIQKILNNAKTDVQAVIQQIEKQK